MGVEERYKKKKEEGKASTLYNGVENRHLAKNAEAVGQEVTQRVNTWLANNKTYFSVFYNTAFLSVNKRLKISSST